MIDTVAPPSPPSPMPQKDSPNSNSGLTTGAIIGITTGIFVTGGLSLMVLLRPKKKNVTSEVMNGLL